MLRPSITIAAAALALSAAGCGVGSSTSSSTVPAAPKAPSPAKVQQTEKALAARGAALRQCSHQAGHDPRALVDCLAKHGVVVPKLAKCIEGASSSAGVEACVAKVAG